MGDKSLIWIWVIAAIFCLVQGIRDGNIFWFFSVALCVWNAIRWYLKYFK